MPFIVVYCIYCVLFAPHCCGGVCVDENMSIDFSLTRAGNSVFRLLHKSLQNHGLMARNKKSSKNVR